MFPLMAVGRESPLLGCQIRQKAKPSDAIGADLLTVDICVASDEVAQILPLPGFCEKPVKNFYSLQGSFLPFRTRRESIRNTLVCQRLSP
jgi:hypothetical protein